MSQIRTSRITVAVILTLSVILRLVLAGQGGQRYFWDEERYDNGIKLYRGIVAGEIDQIRAVVTSPDHAFFNWLAAFVAAGQHGLSQFTPYGDWSNLENITRTLWLGASLLSLASSINLFLLYLVARKAGATEWEAKWALFLMAAANSAFYYSRHFLPYDASLSSALAAVLFGIARPSNRSAILCGLFAGITYNLYNGYWYLVPIIWLVHAYRCRSEDHRLHFWLTCSSTVAITLAFPVALGATLGGSDYWSNLRAFGSSVKLGLFAEGWSLPWEYFWHAEGVLGAMVVGTIVLAFILTQRDHVPIPGWVKITLAALLIEYALLILFSNVLAYFVVYARTVKPFVPLLCLLGGWAINVFVVSRPQMRPIVACAIALAAVISFSPHFTRIFPRDVESAVLRNWGNPKRTLSITGSLYWFSGRPVTRPDLALVNNRELFPMRSYVGYPAGKTLLRFNHPLTYIPFQYECHLPRERALIRSQDISIQLIQLSDPDALPDDPPMSMLYRVEDRPTGYDRVPQTPNPGEPGLPASQAKER